MRFSRLLAGVALVTGGILLGNSLMQSKPENLAQNQTTVAARPEAPAEPNIVSNRREDGGPDLRRSYEMQKLVDPATGEIPANILVREQQFAKTLPVRDETGPLQSLTNKGNLAGWAYRGPHNVGGRTRALAIDVLDLSYQTFLAGGVSGGMWRSTDEGANWTMTTGSSQLHSVTTVAQDTRPGSTVWYYGTGELRGNSAGGGGAPYRGDGIFKSTDSGVTWNSLPATAGGNPEAFSTPWQYVSRVAVDASNLVQDEVYASIYGQVLRSTDGGNTWTVVLGGTSSPWSVYTDVIVADNGVVYASMSSEGTQPGIFRSTDGITWANITPAGLSIYDRIVMTLAPSNQNIMYALVADIESAGDPVELCAGRIDTDSPRVIVNVRHLQDVVDPVTGLQAEHHLGIVLVAVEAGHGGLGQVAARGPGRQQRHGEGGGDRQGEQQDPDLGKEHRPTPCPWLPGSGRSPCSCRPSSPPSECGSRRPGTRP